MCRHHAAARLRRRTSTVTWSAEDGGPRRRQLVSGPGPATALRRGAHLTSAHRDVFGANMVVTDDAGRVFLQGNTMGGSDTTGWVERIDPVSLAPLTRSADLPGGPYWAGGALVLPGGDLAVTYSQWCHRLDPDTLETLAARRLPRSRAYNSLVALESGPLVMKDFDPAGAEPCSLAVLDPSSLKLLDEVDLPEASIARLSADGDTVIVVGTHSVFRLVWDGENLVRDDAFAPRYRTMDGQTFGWDAVLAAGCAWFLDNGDGTDRFAGAFTGQGISTAPLHLIRVDLATGGVTMAEICGRPNGLIANPPIIDESRSIAVGYDSGNGVITAFDVDLDQPSSPMQQRWSRDQCHASHLLLWPDDGGLLVFDHAPSTGDHAVILDISTGEQLGRVATGSPIQTVLFPAPAPAGGILVCSHTTLSRITTSAT